MKPPEDAKQENWSRFFGSLANNTAWTLAELPSDQIDRTEMLNCAHAAAWHWQQVGAELNRMRALMLLAEAHAKVGLGSTALAYAEAVRSYFVGAASTPDWEIAFVHVVHAHAASCAGAADQHARSYAQAIKAIAAVASEKDREIIERVFRHVPAP